MPTSKSVHANVSNGSNSVNHRPRQRRCNQWIVTRPWDERPEKQSSIPGGGRDVSLHRSVQMGSAVRPSSCPVDTGCSFCNGKAARREAHHLHQAAGSRLRRAVIQPLSNLHWLTWLLAFLFSIFLSSWPGLHSFVCKSDLSYYLLSTLLVTTAGPASD